MQTSRLSNFINQRHGALRVIALGDSVTQNDSAVSSGLWSQGNGWFETLIKAIISQQRGPEYTFVRNAGVAGNTTPNMEARLDTDVLAYTPDTVFIMAGTNDIVSGQTNSQYQTFFNSLERIIVRCLLAGSNVILSTCPTKNACPAEVARAIPWYYMLAKQYGIPLIDSHRATADPVTGQYVSGYSDDGTHPNQTGIAAIVSYALNTTFSNDAVKYGAAYRACVATTTGSDPANLINNGNFVNKTTPPNLDFWTVNTTGASFTQDTPSDANISGKIFHYTKTAAGGAYALYGASIAKTNYADGDVLEMNGLFAAIGITGSPINGFTMLGQFDSADSVRPWNTHLKNVGVSGALVPFSQEFVIPSGYGGSTGHDLTPQLFVQDIGQYFVADWTVWNRTAYEAIWKPGQFKG